MATEEQMQQLADEAIADLKDPLAAIGRLNEKVARLEEHIAAKDAALQQARDKVFRNSEMQDMSVEWRTASVAALQLIDNVAALYDTGECRH